MKLAWFQYYWKQLIIIENHKHKKRHDKNHAFLTESF